MKKIIAISFILMLLSGCNPYRSVMVKTLPALDNSQVLINQYVPESDNKSDTLDMIKASKAAIKEAI